jgi:mono/diheme cytochrome c family protein
MSFQRSLVVRVAALAGSAVALAACGSEEISVPKTSPYYHGAVLFKQHCAGCHTLSVAGTEGSATAIVDRLRNQGPNFNLRKETVQTVLYAIRNGGFSGQIMPQNLVVGREAEEVAEFLAHYAGRLAPKVPSVEISLPGEAKAQASTPATSTTTTTTTTKSVGASKGGGQRK